MSDENLGGDMLRGLLLRMPELDVARVQDVGLAQSPDPAILASAVGERRVEDEDGHRFEMATTDVFEASWTANAPLLR